VRRRQTTRKKGLGGFVSWLVHITLSLLCGKQKRQNPPRERLGNHRWQSVKLVGAGAVSQRLIPTGEQSGLLTRIGATGRRFVVRADEKLMAFLELESAIRLPRLGLTSRPDFLQTRRR